VSCPLVIFAPRIGTLSETFIQRHMEDLLPGGTIVVTEAASGTNAGQWTVACPTAVLNQIARLPLRLRVLRFSLKKLGWKLASPEIIAVRKFLGVHNVTVALGEYLDLSLPWFEVCQQLDIRFFAHAHGYDVTRNLRNPQWCKEYLRYNDAEGVITMSQASRQSLLKLGLEPSKVHVVPYGVKVPNDSHKRHKSDVVRCLAVGRMVAKKSPITTLEVFRRAAKVCPSLRLDYVGAGELFAAAREFVHVTNLGGRVTLHGAQPSDVVQTLMDQADIFLQHSMTDPETGDAEGLPVAILEAMAKGLPVVSTRHAGIPEAVEESATGYLVAEGDATEMAERIVQLAEDCDLRRRMGEDGWRRAKKYFSWERERAELLNILGLNTAPQ